jgi:hypothetical protein
MANNDSILAGDIKRKFIWNPILPNEKNLAIIQRSSAVPKQESSNYGPNCFREFVGALLHQGEDLFSPILGQLLT